MFNVLIDCKMSHLCLQTRRHAEFIGLKKQIILHMEELDHSPESSFEKDVVCEHEDSFCLSTENITSLKLLICHVSLARTRVENPSRSIFTERWCSSAPTAGGT